LTAERSRGFFSKLQEAHMKPTFPPVLRMADFETIKLERDLDGGRLEVTGTLPTGLTVRATFTPSPEPKETWETIDWQIVSP
jgi:hypothetical protein